jgi:hypothetical protein
VVGAGAETALGEVKLLGASMNHPTDMGLIEQVRLEVLGESYLPCLYAIVDYYIDLVLSHSGNAKERRWAELWLSRALKYPLNPTIVRSIYSPSCQCFLMAESLSLCSVYVDRNDSRSAQGAGFDVLRYASNCAMALAIGKAPSWITEGTLDVAEGIARDQELIRQSAIVERALGRSVTGSNS